MEKKKRRSRKRNFDHSSDFRIIIKLSSKLEFAPLVKHFRSAAEKGVVSELSRNRVKHIYSR